MTLTYDKLLSTFALKFNLRRYKKEGAFPFKPHLPPVRHHKEVKPEDVSSRFAIHAYTHQDRLIKYIVGP